MSLDSIKIIYFFLNIKLVIVPKIKAGIVAPISILIKVNIIITIGIILVAISIEYFFAPNNLAAGGVTGVAIVLNYLFPYIGVGILTFIINLLLFIVAFVILGGSFGTKSIFATVGLSVVMWIIEEFLNPFAVTEDLMIATIFGTIISAFGMAIVFNNNSSTGGTDIIAKIINKFLHINIGISLLIIDIIIKKIVKAKNSINTNNSFDNIKSPLYLIIDKSQYY